MVSNSADSNYLPYTSEHNKKLIETIELLSVFRAKIRKYVPEFKIPINDSKDYLLVMEKVAENMQEIFDTLGIIHISSDEIKKPSKSIKDKELDKFGNADTFDSYVSSGTELLDRVNDDIVIVSANKSKKKLKSLGISPQNIKSIGGPIDVSDYEIMGKDLNEQAKQGITKKLVNFKQNLAKQLANDENKDKRVFFIFSVSDPTDIVNLQRIDSLSGEINRDKIYKIKIQSWDSF